MASGREPQVIQRLVEAEAGVGTLFVPDQEPMAARKQWLASHLQMAGRLHLDEGAAGALRESGKSLLPVGVAAVEGAFSRGEVVACLDPQGREIARGLVNYAADEARAMQGLASHQIESCLGYVDDPELIHRDNMVVMG